VFSVEQAKVVTKLSSMLLGAQKAHIVDLEAALRDQVRPALLLPSEEGKTSKSLGTVP